jgi:hypothetical protein
VVALSPTDFVVALSPTDLRLLIVLANQGGSDADPAPKPAFARLIRICCTRKPRSGRKSVTTCSWRNRSR